LDIFHIGGGGASIEDFNKEKKKIHCTTKKENQLKKLQNFGGQ